MSEIVKRVAKAIAATDFPETHGKTGEEKTLRQARAAIEAMAKGPTDCMTEHKTYTSGQWSRRNYDAIFAAALASEDEGKRG